MVAKYCIYRHSKPDGTPFYIGKGIIKRPYSKHHRNKHWHNIVNKYGYGVEILANFLTEEDAFELDKTMYQKDIALLYGVSRQTIKVILKKVRNELS